MSYGRAAIIDLIRVPIRMGLNSDRSLYFETLITRKELKVILGVGILTIVIGGILTRLFVIR